ISLGPQAGISIRELQCGEVRTCKGRQCPGIKSTLCRCGCPPAGNRLDSSGVTKPFPEKRHIGRGENHNADTENHPQRQKGERELLSNCSLGDRRYAFVALTAAPSHSP